MANGELENRDAEELGDLSEDLGIERGELFTSQVAAPGGPQFPEMQAASRAQRGINSTGLGAPVLDYTVRSIYDSRPVNSREFNIWTQLSTDSNHSTITLNALQRCFKTPRGYVTNIRKVMFIGPALAMAPNITAFLRLLVDEAAVDPPTVETGPSLPGSPGLVFPSQTAIPVARCGEFDAFQLVDEGHFIGVQVTYNPALGALSRGQLLDTYIGFYGQFLLKTGVPPLFQAANEGSRARTANTVPATANGQPAGGVTGGLQFAKRRAKDPFAGVPVVNDPRFRPKR